VSGPSTILCIGGGSDLHVQARLALLEFGTIREIPGGRDQTPSELEHADLLVVTAPALASDREFGWWLRERTGAALLLLHAPDATGSFADRGFDDWAVEDSAEEIRQRTAMLLAFREAWQRGKKLSLDRDSLQADLTHFGTDPSLVDERGLLTPGRVAIEHLVDVEATIRQQLAICRLMGTSYGTFLNSEEPRGLPCGDVDNSVPMGALSPYCAYLAGKGDHCLQSEFKTAHEALRTGQPVERECAGGLLLLAVPVILSFGGMKWPLYAATVAVSGTAEPEAIERAAAESGANQVILQQLMEESRFWVLNPDKVDGIRSTLTNLAETVSREVSHKYGTAYQVYHRALDEQEIHLSRELLARGHEELERTNRSLRLKNEEIYEVTQAITHDLRKPLSSLNAMISLLAKGALGDLTDAQREAVDTANEANGYMMNLVGDLLEAARLETGRKLMDMDEILLRPLVARVRRRFKYQVEAEGIRIEVEDLPETVWCDEPALEKVFMNLIGNSIAYIGDGERRIRIQGTVDGESARISVADTGMGIPDASRERVFEKFHRAQNALAIRGTGLGLGIVKAIVEAHGGNVEIESEVGAGSTISFTLPLRNPAKSTGYSANPVTPAKSIGK
jgi:signal transduction histidine kinase